MSQTTTSYSAHNLITLQGLPAAPGVSSGLGIIYYDSVLNHIFFAENGGGFTQLGSETAAGISVGSSPIAGGTTTRVLYDNAGVLGEYAISGTGSVAMTTSPIFVTPVLGAATATSINKLTLTQPATSSTLTIPDGVTLNAGAGGTLGSNAFTSTAFVPQTTTVNGKALSGNISLASTDLSDTANIALLNAANVFTNNQTISGGSLTFSGNISGSGLYSTSGIRHKGIAATFLDTTSSGTVATAYTNVFGGNTLTATSATTITNYFSGYFNDPTASTNITLTNKWALGADSAKFGTSSQVTISNTGVISAISPVFVTPSLGAATATSLNGNTFTAGTYTLTGAAGKVLTFNNTLTFTGTDSSSVGFGTGGTVLYGNQSITLSGDITGSGTTAITTALANIPTTTPAAGSIIYTNIAAPSSPAAGKVAAYSDSTDLRFHDKNASGTIGTTVVSDTGAANNFLTAISAAGVISKAQPTPANVGLGSVTNDAQTKAAIVPNTAPGAGQILAGNAGGTAYAPVTVSGSGATITASSAGVFTISAIANASLSNSAVTVGSTSISLGATQATIAGLTLTAPVINGATSSGSTSLDFSGNSGTFKTSTGAVTIGSGAVGITGVTTLTPPARSSGSASYFTLNIPADTGLATATESIGYQHVTATRTFVDGTIALQRENFLAGPTYNKTTTSATFTDVFTVYFTPPIAGTGVTFTRGHTLGIVDSTSAASSITGGLVVATTLGTSATSVGIGGGNINAGGNGTFGGTLNVTTSITDPIIYGGTGASSTLQLFGTSSGSPSNAVVTINQATSGTVPGGLNIGTPASPGTAAPYNSQINIQNTDAVAPSLGLINFGAASAIIRGWGIGGTTASPTATPINQILLQLSGLGWDATNLFSAARATITLNAAANWSSTDNSSEIRFSVTPGGTRTLTEAARFQNGGNLNFAAGGYIGFGSLTTPTAIFQIKGGRVTAQSAANASIATFTVGTNDSSFHVSANMNVTVVTALSTTLQCTYTDESNAARTLILPVQQLNGNFVAGGLITGLGAWETPVMHIRAKGGTTITILTATGTFTGVTYTAEGVITQIQ
jgi:hypothetical protein